MKTSAPASDPHPDTVAKLNRCVPVSRHEHGRPGPSQVIAQGDPDPEVHVCFDCFSGRSSISAIVSTVPRVEKYPPPCQDRRGGPDQGKTRAVGGPLPGFHIGHR